MAYDPELDEPLSGDDSASREPRERDPRDGQCPYEVFAQFGGSERPITHQGSVRAAYQDLAWHAAKEAYTRRENCSLLWVIPRTAIVSSTEEDEVVLQTGRRLGFRQPAYPGRLRRSRTESPPDGSRGT